ncbi:MAG TPA: hypothetical protein VKX46_06525 [Ktedonobacteraceae bacterium]|nr:hypothetical protein [Ktedonobacteraceae bacterium]
MIEIKQRTNMENYSNSITYPGQPRVLINYSPDTLTQEAQQRVQRLLADLRNAEVDITVDTDGEVSRDPVDTISLQKYQWIIVVQTPEALQSPRIQAIIRAGAELYEQQKLRGILRVQVSPTWPPSLAQPWPDAPAFDISQDYPRALAGILLLLNTGTTIMGVAIGKAPALAPLQRSTLLPAFITKGKRPLRLTLLLLICIAGVIFASYASIFSHFNIVPTVPTAKTSSAPITNTPPRPTPTVTQNPFTRITSQKPALIDPLQAQDAQNWQTGAFTNGLIQCVFTAGTFQVSLTPSPGKMLRKSCLAQSTLFGNLALQANMQILQGDAGGIVLRAQSNNNYYGFLLDSAGCYDFFKVVNQQMHSIVPHTCTQLNMQGSKQITVIAQQTNFSFYVDGNLLDMVQDNTFSSGQIGVVGIARTHQDGIRHTTLVAFSNIKVWQL